MTKYGLKFEHIGLACRDPAFAVLFYNNQGYEVAEPVFDPEQKVNLILCKKSNEPEIEIVYPFDDQEGPLRHLLKEKEALIYHLCYSSVAPEVSLQALKDDGFRVVCVSRPKEALLFGKRVSFYNIKGLGIIELIHE